jgi:hypothetical protein
MGCIISTQGYKCEMIQMKPIRYSEIADSDDDYDIWFEDIEFDDVALFEPKKTIKSEKTEL